MKLNQIQTIVRAFKDSLPQLFPDRTAVPKTLIIAKSRSHLDIIQTVREEFAEGSDFCKKVTYKAKEDSNAALADFCNFNPRIIVAVDMIVTGTAIKPVECLIFMPDVLPPVPSDVIGN